jgi:hypothetical protein
MLIPIEWRQVAPLLPSGVDNIKVEASKKEGHDDVVLELGELVEGERAGERVSSAPSEGNEGAQNQAHPHSETRMTTCTPSDVGKRRLLVLSALGQVASRIPLGRPGVDLGVLMDLVEVVGE